MLNSDWANNQRSGWQDQAGRVGFVPVNSPEGQCHWALTLAFLRLSGFDHNDLPGSDRGGDHSWLAEVWAASANAPG